MKKILLLGMALSFFAIHISAQDVYEIQKMGNEITLVSKDKTPEKIGELKCSPELLQRYGEKTIIAVHQSCNLTIACPVDVKSTPSWQYSKWGIYRQKNTTEELLAERNSEIIECPSYIIFGKWIFAWETILFWVLSLVSGLLIKSYQKIKAINTNAFFIVLGAVAAAGAIASMVGVSCIAAVIGVIAFAATLGIAFVGASTSAGWFIIIGIITWQWLPLCVSITLLGIGVLCAYLYPCLLRFCKFIWATFLIKRKKATA
jgi:hypothetical protein